MKDEPQLCSLPNNIRSNSDMVLHWWKYSYRNLFVFLQQEKSNNVLIDSIDVKHPTTQNNRKGLFLSHSQRVSFALLQQNCLLVLSVSLRQLFELLLCT